jgi:hypothetical protein
MKEYALWGYPPDKKVGEPLGQTLMLGGSAITLEEVERVKKLASAKGWHDFRVQVIDISQPFNAGKAFASCVK